MSEKTLKTRIVNKHDTEANWLKATTFIPKQGELIVYDIDDTHNYERFKIGDGSTLVSNLPFADMSEAERTKLSGIEAGANKTIVDSALSSSSTNPVQNKVISEALAEKAEAEHIHAIEDISDLSDALTSINTDYNETIIGLSVSGQTVTYIKGDGSVHSFETQDTNTTYSLGTDEVTGLTKLYATIGSAEDGTMTQKAIKTELDKKVGVSLSNKTLIFTV